VRDHRRRIRFGLDDADDTLDAARGNLEAGLDEQQVAS